ncbi:hypothetical protein [Pseudoxanthomonas sp.]|jgi:UDP-N-acetylmuramyl pentapeptide phosphotransferase/UDP-N-acetylglucosamine-1-phosphate transferase|uniref:hypothetical protein n=1 Tax=Pseudoxanthomonas sp. TaxID=1871049 RepID=UPI002E0F4015|nr:hypothetical protein [Pseudoxanthomonas sp.]
MGRLSNLRASINRDDGRFYRAGNTAIGPWSIIGGLAFVASLILSQLHWHLDLHVGWAIGVGIAGLASWCLGGIADDRRDDA